jgi:hypothetical protein
MAPNDLNGRSRMQERLMALARADAHPLCYVGLYLACLVVFGFAYSGFCPEGFYAPYSRFEPNFVADQGKLASALEKSFQEAARNLTQIKPDSLKVIRLGATDESSVAFTLAYRMRPLRASSEYTIPMLHVTLMEPNKLSRVDLEKNRNLSIQNLPIREEDKRRAQSIAENLFQQYNSDSLGTLELDDTANGILNDYLAGLRGNPLTVSGKIIRMFYLSTVVITTLGLGDIVPISPRARFLVGWEAIFGVTIAGYFLTAVANRARR